MILFLLFLIPVLAILVGLLSYKHNGKRELIRLDLVQFIYAFVIYPLMFVWLKSFLYYLLSKELEIRLSVTEMFVIDTFFTVIMLFVFAFLIIHALTKSFNLKYYRDPLYDIFEHSEYYHVWLSHLGMYFGMMLLFVLLAILNIFFPFEIAPNREFFFFILFSGLGVGLLGFLGLWLSDSEETQFMRLIKLGIAAFFTVLVVAYFALDPKFNLLYGWYWFTAMGFFSMVICSFLFEKSQKAKSLADRFKHYKWNYRLKGDWSKRWGKK